LKQINYIVENVRNLNEDDHLLYIFMEFRHVDFGRVMSLSRVKIKCRVWSVGYFVQKVDTDFYTAERILNPFSTTY